ncbi:hypothetical protein B6U96_13060 [Archaeoglobales archaeon ex4484_92]|nr:MAG: hypothetical protein B6U96_13060 [Archaeoglobales archaeon ex4484_92]
MKEILREIYDRAAKTGSSLINRVDKTTLGNMMAAFESIDDPEEATKFLIAYTARQIGRREIPRPIGQNILKDIVFIYKNCSSDELRSMIFKYLTLLRWFYECGYHNLNSFDDFINKLR